MKTKINLLLHFALILFCCKSFAQQSATAKKPFSDAVKAGKLLFVSGQLGISADTGAKGDFRKEVQQAIENVAVILKNNKLSLKHIVSVTVYLTKLEQFELFNQIYTQRFSEPFPARTCVLVQNLVKHANIEISVVAKIP